jgi:hypothetical protein
MYVLRNIQYIYAFQFLLFDTAPVLTRRWSAALDQYPPLPCRPRPVALAPIQLTAHYASPIVCRPCFSEGTHH